MPSAQNPPYFLFVRPQNYPAQILQEIRDDCEFLADKTQEILDVTHQNYATW